MATQDRPEQPRGVKSIASASELRDLMRQLELGIANLNRGTADQAAAVVRDMHAVQRALPRLEQSFGIELKAERARLQTLEGALRHNAALLVGKAGGSRLRSVRDELDADPDDWWLNLDSMISAGRSASMRKLAIRLGIGLVVVLVLAVVYQLFLAPKPTESERLRSAGDLLNQGQLEKARTEYGALVEAGAGGMQAPLALGAILTQLGQEADAQAYLDQARALAPSTADYYAELANLYYRMASQGGLDTVAKAEEAAQAALAEDPNSANAYLALGGVYELQGRVGEAIVALERASELSTDTALTAAIRMRLAMLSQRPSGLPTPVIEATASGQ